MAETVEEARSMEVKFFHSLGARQQDASKLPFRESAGIKIKPDNVKELWFVMTVVATGHFC